MKKLTLLIPLLCAMCAMCAAAQDTARKTAENADAGTVESVTWLNRVHDFGAFDEDTKQKTAFFRFVNTTAVPVTILSATATCGCTVPQYSTEAIEPGDTATITVSYDPSGRPGRFDKQVYVRTSDSYDRTKLVIRGTVIGNPQTINARYPMSMGPLKLRSGAAMLGKAAAGHDKMHYIDGYNMSADTLQPVLVAAPVWLSMTTTPGRVAPGDLLSLNIEFHGASCPHWGVVTDSVMIAPVSGAEAYALPVVVIVEEDFTHLSPRQRADAPVAAVEADRVQLHPVAEGATSPVTASLRLTNRGNDPLLVRRVYSQDPGVEVSVADTEVRKGKSTDIKVTYDPSVQPSGVINARFTLITNDPSSPTQTIRIVGERK